MILQCERCGGTGQQLAGLYNWKTKKYDSLAGTCDDCSGIGKLGEVKFKIYEESKLDLCRTYKINNSLYYTICKNEEDNTIFTFPVCINCKDKVPY